VANTYPVLRTAAEWDLYHTHLQSDHDYEIWAEVLTMEEALVSTVDVLDGQVNFVKSQDNSPERTGSLILSDPEGALSFGTSFARDDDSVLWVNRLIRIQHRVVVPALGPVSCVPLVGVPTTVARKGGEITLELGDKSLLANHGVRAHTYKKGLNIRGVLVSIMRDLTGEWHYRIPATRRTLSKSYTVGMGEDVLTPWAAFRRIAAAEMGWRGYYSADGYATCEPTTTKQRTVPIEAMLALPDSAASFTDFINYVRVTSHRKITMKGKPGKKDDRTINVTYDGIGVLPATNDLSEQGLRRHGVLRTLPLVIGDDDLKTIGAVKARVVSELATGSAVSNAQSYEIMPMFHLDKYDYLNLPLNIGSVIFDQASIPLGTGGNMTLGALKWVSKAVKTKNVRLRTRYQKKKKGGKKNG
jgi:hypothetical protein